MANPIAKLKTVTAGGNMSLSVKKTGGPVTTRAFVGSTGSDDRAFDDSQLTPGPANMPLQAKNSYSVVWLGAFVGPGSAELTVVVNHTGGKPPSTRSVKVNGKAGDSFMRVVMVP